MKDVRVLDLCFGAGEGGVLNKSPFFAKGCHCPPPPSPPPTQEPVASINKVFAQSAPPPGPPFSSRLAYFIYTIPYDRVYQGCAEKGGCPISQTSPLFNRFLLLDISQTIYLTALAYISVLCAPI